jgi:hypothetical protein
METNEKCVQSYMPHSVTFLIREEGGNPPRSITIPSVTDKKPYLVMTDEDIVRLADDPTFKTMKDNNLVKFLPAIPARFMDIADTLVKAREENSTLREKNAQVESEARKKDEKIAELQKIIDEQLGENAGALTPEKLAELKARLHKD